MAIKIGSNLAYQGKLFDFERQYFATKALMKAFPETSVPDGYEAYCGEDNKWYEFNSHNAEDPNTGKWTLRKVGTTIEIADNLTTAEKGKALDASQGKALNDKITTHEEKYNELNIKVSGIETNHTSLNGVVTELTTTRLPGIDKKIETNKTSIAAINNAKGVANGFATLDQTGKVPANQLPSYVDDVIELENVVATNPTQGMTVGKKWYNRVSNKIFTATSATAGTESTPEADKIYVVISNNTAMRWSGTVLVPIGNSLTLGETASTAYRGDRGKELYDWMLNTVQEATNKIRLNNIPRYVVAKNNDSLISSEQGPENAVIYYGFKDINTGEQKTGQLNFLSANSTKCGMMTAKNVQQLNKLMNQVFPFGVNFAIAGTNIFEKGSTNNVRFNWSFSNDDVNAVVKQDFNGENVPLGTKTKLISGVTTNKTYTLTITYNGDKTIVKNQSVIFVNASYCGIVEPTIGPTNISEAKIKSLTKTVKNSKVHTTTFNLNNQKICYAYPKSLGAITAIKDANNFDYLNSYDVTEITVNGEIYYVYILKEPTTISGFKQAFS